MAQSKPKPKRRSRKRNRRGAAAAPGNIERRAPARAHRATAATPGQRAHPLKTYGDPPPNRFGGFPVAELAILAGAIGFTVGLVDRNAVAAIAGMVVCALGVLEFSVREHFSGYRSHTSLLAAFPAVIIEALLVAVIRPRHPAVLLLPAVPIYAGAFILLRRRFLAARQLRLARPPAP